jgi:hypothetical protein
MDKPKVNVREMLGRARILGAMHAFLAPHMTPRPQITNANRLHREKAREGSPEHVAALNAAELKRLRKAAKRAGGVTLPASDAVDTSVIPK